jgi:integrase
VLSSEVAGRLGTWAPRGPHDGASFARVVVEAAEPTTWARARSLLWAASRLGAFAVQMGHGADPAVVLESSFIERFVETEVGRLSAPARRTLRSNLLFLAREVHRSGPRPVPLSRERAAAPYSEAELRAYLSLADAQPTMARARRASGLIALGAGAGLIGADLRLLRGSDVAERSGGVVVAVRGARARTVPVRAELAQRALGAARFSTDDFIVGGAEPSRRNVTSPLIASLCIGPDLERLSLARLRSTWVARCAADIGLATFMAAAGVRCSQRLGDVVAGLDVGSEEDAVVLLGGRRR